MESKISVPLEVRNCLARAEVSVFAAHDRRPPIVGTAALLDRWRWVIDRVGAELIIDSEWLSLLSPRRDLRSVMRAAQTHASLDVLSWLVPIVDGLDDQYRQRTVPGWLSNRLDVDAWWERRVPPEHARGGDDYALSFLRGSQVHTPREADSELDRDFVGVEIDGALAAVSSFENQDLAGADLSNLDLSGVDFTGADLSRADLSGAILNGASLDGADLTLADCDGLQAADVTGRGVVARLASFRGADMRRALLPGFNAAGAAMRGADFSNADLNEGTLSMAELGGARFDGATLTGVDMTAAAVPNATFVKADLHSATLEDVRMKGHTDEAGPFEGAINMTLPTA